MGEIAHQRRIKRLEFLAGFLAPLPIPVGPIAGTEIVSTVLFTFTTGTLVLGALLAGAKFNRAAILIETPFDDPVAAIRLGTSASLGLLLGAAESKPTIIGQYDSDAIVVIPSADVLLLTVNPGASSQGAGLLLYKVLPT